MPPQATVEQCAGCHMGTVTEKHALNELDGVDVKLQHWSATRSARSNNCDTNADGTNDAPCPAVVAETNGNITIRFNVWANGVPRIDFQQKAALMRNHNEDAWWYYDSAIAAGVRAKLSTAAFGTAAGTWQFVGNGNGNYTATIFNLAPTAHATDAGTTYMLSVMGPNEATATAVAVIGAPVLDTVSDAACQNCHGNHIWKGVAHDVTSGQGVGACIVCHVRDGALETRLTGYMPVPNPGNLPAQAAQPGTAGTGLMGIVHGIHNAKNMPDGKYTWIWPSNGNATDFTNGFPGNMNNCQTCHRTDAQLAAVMAAPISYALCVSCHDNVSQSQFPGALTSHNSFGPLAPWAGQTSCTTCHTRADGVTPQTVADFHNGQITERAGFIWDGADQSIVLAPTTVTEITGATVNGANVEVTWTANNSVTSAALNPCNQDFAQGPVFYGANVGASSEGCTATAAGCASNMAFVRAYATGDDWTNEQLTGSSAPGQPPSVSLQGTDNTKAGYTTCASNVATTVMPLSAWTAGFTLPTKGIIALQGKAQTRFAPAVSTTLPDGPVIWIRTKSATREFNVADYTAPAAARRQLVDVNKCNACHYGTLYQHGGNRVDSIELCVMCHNPASSEQNRRIGMGITAANAYDGLDGQTYDMRYMVHAIHAAGENGKQLMFYRSNGIYFFGSKATLATITNWPPNQANSPCVTCYDAEDGWLTQCPVYGSVGTDAAVTRNADGTCGTGAATTSVWRPHRVIEVEYPRALNDCGACHVDGAVDMLPDATKAVGVTFNTGASSDWKVLVDDVLMGPSAASCMSCHRSGDAAVQTGLQNHANGFGWAPAVFPQGRQTLIDAATP